MVHSNTNNSRNLQKCGKDVVHLACPQISQEQEYKDNKYKKQLMFHIKFRSRKRRQVNTRKSAGSKWRHFRKSDKTYFLLIFKNRSRKRKDALKKEREFKKRKRCRRQNRTKSSQRRKKKEKNNVKNSSKIRRWQQLVQIKQKASKKQKAVSNSN